MIPPGGKHIVLLLFLFLPLIITFLTQSIIAASHHNTEPAAPAAQFDEEEIIDVFARDGHETNSSSSQQQQLQGSARDQEPQLRPIALDSYSAGAAAPSHKEKPELLFAWRRLPTNRCSKSCGRGLRLHHLSCIDLKYNVRVEEKFCLEQPNLLKPAETGDEPCNELDCPPEWASIEYRECSPPPEAISMAGSAPVAPGTPPAKQLTDRTCQLNVYKRVQCMMVDRTGKSIQLADSRCTTTTLNHTSAISSTSKDAHSSPSESSAENDDDRDVEITLDEEDSIPDSSNERSNDISPTNNDRDDDEINFLYLRDAPSSSAGSSNMLTPSLSSGHLGEDDDQQGKQSSRRTNNEPFYELGTWSECSGASCGQLGKRIRMVSCRLFLLKSTKFVELPVSSCQHLPAPDLQEPCYLDCLPQTIDQQSLEEPNRHQAHSQQPKHHHNQHHQHLQHPEQKNHDIHGLAQLIENNDQILNDTLTDLEIMRYTWKTIKQKLRSISY